MIFKDQYKALHESNTGGGCGAGYKSLWIPQNRTAAPSSATNAAKDCTLYDWVSISKGRCLEKNGLHAGRLGEEPFYSSRNPMFSFAFKTQISGLLLRGIDSITSPSRL